MSDLSAGSPMGVLRQGWSAVAGDYAIAEGWSRCREVLMVGDARGRRLCL